jgi:glucosamine--fructose-6-phosphate aminotransferase (isomerizing)
MLMALQLSEDRISFTERRNQIIDGLRALPAQIKSVLESDKSLRELANSVLANSRSLLLMGRGYQSVALVHDLIRKTD